MVERLRDLQASSPDIEASAVVSVDGLSIASALSHAGMQAQAEFFKQWAKRTEQDVRTRSAYAAVTAFSNGRFFGFRVRPRLKAIENPSLFGSRSANVLEPQAFPVVVIIGMDTDDLKLGFDVKRDSDGEPIMYKNRTVKLEAFEPTLCFRQTVNWLPNNSSKGRASEVQRMRWARSYINACAALEDVRDEIDDEELYDFIGNRIELLEYNMLDLWSNQYIPMELIISRQ